MKQKNFLVAIICLLLTANVFSVDIYVGTNVTDSGAIQGSQDNPYSSLSDAIQDASDSDKIIIVGTITQNLPITFNKSITFEGGTNAIIQSTDTNRLFNISSASSKSITFTGITFQNFNSDFQGSVLNNSLQTGMTLNFSNCNFLNNSTSASNGGGVFYFSQDPTVNFTDCTFYNNAVVTSTASNARGGAIHFNGSANGNITNCTFSENKVARTANFDGAAIRVSTVGCDITITNSLFYNNKASNGSGPNSDFNGVPGATMNLVNSLAEFTNNVDTTTGSEITANFTNTTFTFINPNVTFNAPNSLTDDTPIDFGNDNNDVGAWDSKINIFEGTTSLLWSLADNWSSGTAPVGDGSENIAIIGANCNMFSNVAINNIKVTSEFRIQNQQAFIVNGESDVTDGGLVRYFTQLANDSDVAKDWYLVSSPLSGEVFDTAFANKNDLAEGSDSNRGVATYNTTGANWSYFSGTDINAISGKGFSMKITPDGTTFDNDGGEYADNLVGFEGDFNTDNAGVDMSLNNVGFNLLGNPYPAHMNSKTFLDANANLDQTQLWVWNQEMEMYEVKTNASAFILAPTQGFFVKVNTIGSVNFAEANQAITGGTFQKSATTELKLLITNGVSKRFAKINYVNQATKGFDAGYEGEVFGGIANSLDVFTNLVDDNQGKKYQIQSLPNSDLESMLIPVGIIADEGEITFSAETLNFPSELKVFLEDRENGIFTRLDVVNSIYKVNLNTALDDVGRFYLHTSSSALSTDTFNAASISIHSTNKSTLRIVGLAEGESSVKLFNLLGKQVMTSNFNTTGVKELTLPNLSSGVYIFQLETENGKLNKKIVLE